MSVGTPVLVTDNACLREVLDDGASYMHSEDPEQICKAILGLLEDHSRMDLMVKKGYLRAQFFHWGQMAKETLRKYKNQK